MIPIKLTIEGLYSYQKKQTIDFEKLTSNHLFGIFGTVGSGKSSILEAITFALYGKTDRLLLSGDNRNYNMMNLKSDQLFIAFDFTAGKDMDAYQVQVSAKRNSKKYEDVKKLERAIYKRHNADYIPINQEELETAIGLSYDNFKRTIIIPQGKFQEFLQLKSTERTQMMKELFGLQKYELSHKVKNLEQQNNNNIHTIEGRLTQLGEASTQQQEELKKQLSEIERNINALTTDQKQNNETVQALEKLKDNTSQLNSFKIKQQALDEQKEHIAKLEHNIASYEYCIIHFKSTLDSIAAHQQKMLALKKTLDTDTLLLKDKQTELEKLSTKFEQISADYKTIEELKKEVDSLKKLLEIKNISLKIEEESDRLKNGKGIVDAVIQKLQLLELQERKETILLTELKGKQPDIEKINQAQQWHLKNKNLTTAITDTQNERKITHKQTQIIQEELLQQINKHDISFSSEDKNIWLQQLNQTQQSQEAKLKKINQERDHLLIRSGLENYAQSLTEGRACPLCGSQHHPAPHNSKNISEQIEGLKKEAKKQEALLLNTRQLNQFIDKHLASIQPLQAQLIATDTKISRLQADLALHQQQSIEDDYKDEAQLTNATQRYKTIKADIQKTENTHVQLREAYSKELRNKEKFQEALSKIERDLNKNISSKEMLTGQMSTKYITKYKNDSNEQIVSHTEKLQKRVIEIGTNYENTRNQLEEAKKTIAVLQGKLDTNKIYFENETAQLKQLNSQLEADIEKSTFNDIASIKDILNLQLDIEVSKKKTQEYRDHVQLIHNEIKRLTQELGNQKYNPELHQAAMQRAAECNKKLSETNREHGKVERSLSDLNQRVVLKKELNEQLSKLQLRAADINTLRKLFYKSGFVNYISSVYLQNLCTTANERFYKMTRQSLSLELSEDNSFEVRDYMNGGKLRSVKTLSGGQTFQAALSLALALSDNIQSLTETDRNFFFLDEGFGSLDKESLDIVFGTLKNLRNENRIVGVISHVEEMQQEIPTYLNITQHSETGSRIEESWNR